MGCLSQASDILFKPRLSYNIRKSELRTKPKPTYGGERTSVGERHMGESVAGWTSRRRRRRSPPSLSNLQQQQQATAMNNGNRPVNAPRTRVPGGDLLPSGAQKKRTSNVACGTETELAPVAKKPCHCRIVADTVGSMMHEWFLEENKIYEEDNTTLAEQLEEATRLLNAERRRSNLLRNQLSASRRYSRMVAQWVPQVEEMFNGDYEMIIQIQNDQEAQLEDEIRAEDPGEETEPEDNE